MRELKEDDILLILVDTISSGSLLPALLHGKNCGCLAWKKVGFYSIGCLFIEPLRKQSNQKITLCSRFY